MIDKNHRKANSEEIEGKLKKEIVYRPDKLNPGDYCRIINQVTNEIEFGVIVFETKTWREVQVGNDFKIFSFKNHKFVREYEN